MAVGGSADIFLPDICGKEEEYDYPNRYFSIADIMNEGFSAKRDPVTGD